MKKLFVLIIICGFSFSCTSIKQFSKERIVTKVDCKNIEMNSSMIYFDVLFDGQNQKFLFDTGAGMTVITDSVAIVDYHSKKFGALGTVTGADGKETDLRTFTAEIDSELFASTNKVFAYIPRPLTKCQKSQPFAGILGLDLLLRDENVLQLNFTNNKICNITNTTKQELLNSGYSKIKSEVKSRQIFIYLNIDGKERKFKMDTGFAGSVVIPYNEHDDFPIYNSMSIIGGMYRTATSTTFGEEVFYEDVPLILNDITLPLKIHVSKTIKSQNIGITLLRGFDWIIDYANSEVYLKRNNNIIDSKFNSKAFKYLVAEKDENLFISTKQKHLEQYNIGDQIIEVANTKISSDNICEMQELLNKTQDWSELGVKIIKVQVK
ncbi:aspartyl protease family protein [Flavobacterium ardleyense]|uniref:aspartyl protease family protein n=1 Tax=Flavobacterium ardleyense TaxID=2038737 RepID=UPI00298D3055|nr:aspartyl protease family protein [Flavobacterium ardleyense]